MPGRAYKCPKCPVDRYYGIYIATYAIKRKPPVKCENCDTVLVPA